MKARTERDSTYRKGYKWLVYTETPFGECIDSWHKTKKAAQAVADDYNSSHLNSTSVANMVDAFANANSYKVDRYITQA